MRGGAGGLAVAVTRRRADAQHANGTEEDGRRQAQAKQLDRQVARGAVDQHARHKAVAVKRFGVGSLCELVAAAALHVGQHRGRHGGFRASLQRGKIHRQARHNAAQAVHIDFGLVVAVVKHLCGFPFGVVAARTAASFAALRNESDG